MTTVDPSEKTRHITTWVVLGGIFLILAIIALGVFRSAKATASAGQKADQLIAAVEAKGYPAPSRDSITRTLGDDGGSICQDPNSALRRAVLNSMLGSGAAGPGQRPVINPRLAVDGQVLVMSIYCPEKVADFQKYVDSLKYGDVVKQ